MRINARLNGESEKQIRFLRQQTGKTFTEIIKESLALYYRTVAGDTRKNNQQLLKELAGIGRGPRDGSVKYKEYIADYLDEKYRNR